MTNVVMLGALTRIAPFFDKQEFGNIVIGLLPSNAGSDSSALETVAVLDGDEYVINGSKMFISNAGVAGITIVLAKTDKEASGVQ
jgi:alkylation response protein AidB-like acyl-CoA dehydrogenase